MDSPTNWYCFPQTSEWVSVLTQRFCQDLPSLEHLAGDLRQFTGTTLLNWLNCFELHAASTTDSELIGLGYEAAEITSDEQVYRHYGGLFPAIRLSDRRTEAIGLNVDRIEEFLVARGFPDSLPVVGDPGSCLRFTTVDHRENQSFKLYEQRGTNRYDPAADSPTVIRSRETFRQRLVNRNRHYETLDDAFATLEQMLDEGIERLGRDVTCDLFFEVERQFWQGRNQAAQWQKQRQDSVGMGWANHDHHTYRSSRQAFARLIRLMERLGMRCREQFYAGEGAGWGAQVLDHPVCRPVVFADVDLAADEIAKDFAHESLEATGSPGTIGLWCGLHGEAIFEAGLHHLECQFDFEEIRQQFEQTGITVMPPFTNLAVLKQAFTAGERWQVDESRIAKLEESGWISEEQASNFRSQGAIGSHLEILERQEGYRGFNQSGISEIILRTDPRRKANVPT